MERGGSQENVEVVRKAWNAFLAGDVQAALARAHPDAVAFRAPPLPDAQTYHGPQGVLEMLADWTAPFADFQMRPERFIGAGDHIVVEVYQRATGRASGAVVEGRFWFVYTVADGQITRQEVFNDREQALQDSGPGRGHPGPGIDAQHRSDR